MKRLVVFASLCALLLGCGGGSQGTGGSKGSFQVNGTLLKSDGSPIKGAHVYLIATGSENTTDDGGLFQFNEEALSGEVQALFETESRSFQASLGTVAADESSLDSRVIEPPEGETTARTISVSAKIYASTNPFTGDGPSFENRNGRIVQTRKPRNDAPFSASLGVRYFNSSFPLERERALLQYRLCGDRAWRNIQESDLHGHQVSPGNWDGYGDFFLSTFPLEKNHCAYQVVGPLRIEGIQPISVQFLTLRGAKGE